MALIKIKRLLKLILFILVVASQRVNAQEMIELYINGKRYIRDYPSDMQGALDLINSLVKMNNLLDASFIQYQKVNNDEREALFIKLNTLEQNNNSLKSQLDELITENKKTTQLFNRYVSQNKNNLLLFTSIGPSYNLLDNHLGMDMSLGLIHKISVFNLFDFYAGLNVNTNIYYQEVRNKISNLGVRAVLGVFLK